MPLRTRTKLILLAAVGAAGLAIGASVAGWLLYLNVVARPVRHLGTSMRPALQDGQRIWLRKDVEPLRRGDIVAFFYPEEPDKSFVKRIVGLPGETVSIVDRAVFVDGVRLDEPYVSPDLNKRGVGEKSWVVPEGSYFILGDARDVSNDSRMWGAVPRGLIWGKYEPD